MLRAVLFLKKIAKTILPKRLYDWLKKVFWVLKKRPQKKQNQKKRQYSAPFGVNLFYFHANNSAGAEGHLLESELREAGIPYEVIDLSKPEEFVKSGRKTLTYAVNIIKVHAASETPRRLRLFGIDFSDYYNIGYWAWELAEVPDVFCEGLDMFQEFWTISDFCTKGLEKKAKMPVLTVPLCANPDRDVLPEGRNYFGFDKKPFLFMFAYDCNSFVARKNPQAVVKAFMKAFSPEDSRVGLILKLIYPENYKDHIAHLMEELSPYKNVYYIDKFLSDQEMRTLIKASDAFVSLHRAEGFGLLPLEAMSLGVPVISTAWSGNMEYMTPMNTALVGYTMIPVDGQYVGSIPGDGLEWADADIDDASQQMKRIVEDCEWRNRLIQGGLRTAEQHYDAKSAGRIMRDRLAILGFEE